MNFLYVAAGVLGVAQLVGIYALVTRKADFLFALFILGLVVVAAAVGGYGAYHQIA